MKDFYDKVLNPILPTRFDENEWFAIVITILISCGVYYITVKNRKLLWSEIICIYLLNLQMTTIGDYFLAMPPYDFYDTVDKNSGELTDIILQNIVYPGTILWLMHDYKSKKRSKIKFIIITTVLLSVLEEISIRFFHLFVYKNWEFYYSAFFYLLVMIINVIYYEKLTVFLKKKKLKHSQ
jgi:hypothetical protein